MRILQVYNKRRDWGGEDLSIEDTMKGLSSRGHTVSLWSRDVKELQGKRFGKCNAFLSGIYSFDAVRMARNIIRQNQPDVVHAHNLYPQISPSVLIEFNRSRIATVWHPHDQRPVCATGLSLYRDAPCERCTGGLDYWCILRNCRANIFESFAYAIRNAIHRKLRLYQKYAHITIVWSEFLRKRLLKEGFSPDRTIVVPHPVSIPKRIINPVKGSYIAYLGRLSQEKGIRVLMQAAAQLPHIPFRIAGDPKAMNGEINNVPSNVKMVGWINRAHIAEFLTKARYVVLPSICFETFPTVAIEALSYGIPVIGSRIGGIPEAVVDGSTGLLFEAGNSEQLADKIRFLWENPQLCSQLGMAGREMVEKRYSTDVYIKSLLGVYRLAIELAKK